MAVTQQYSLRWNNYYRHLTYALDNHRTNDDFVDVTLSCDGHKIKAHKVVLSSCSAYFKEIFKENPHPHPVIIFKFIKYEDLNSIIEFMYQGEVNVQQEALQSFLQTAELLAVQGLTAEEKEKPKTPQTPIMEDHKLMKTIPSTIRAISDQNVIIGTTPAATQTIEMPTATILQQPQQQQQQQQQVQVQQPQQHIQQQQQQHLQVQQPQVLQQVSQPQQQQHVTQQLQQHTTTTHQQQQQQQQQQLQQQQQQHLSTANISLPTSNTVKKRKITFSDDDDNIYTTETVDYEVKDEDQTIVKTAEMTFLRGSVKMDIPEYIVSEVDESEQLSDGGGTPQTSQDAGTGGGQNVAQFTSEYEILTESEIEEKYHQADADNTEITIEMGRLLNPTNTSNASNTQVALDETGGVLSGGTGSGGGGGSVKTDNKSSGTADEPLICKVCNRNLNSMNALRRHIASRHSEISDKKHKCTVCNKSFKTQWSLSTHNSRFHRDMREAKECIKMDFV